MAIDGSPRSVDDATRFTQNTPHAQMKSPASSGASSASSSAKASASASATSATARSAGPRRVAAASAMSSGGQYKVESTEDRVRRLRAAHLAARQHEVSRLDRVINVSRRYFDAAHRMTVMTLIGVSGLAFLITCYATVDMMMHNRKRRLEFFALQKQMAEDSLEAARIAYMSGKATPDQIVLVEEAQERARESGTALPSLLSVKGATPAGAAAATEAARMIIGSGDEQQEKPKRTWSGLLFGGLKKEETRDDELDFKREEASASGRIQGAAAAAVSSANEQQQALAAKAKAAFDQERENQRNGGPLDQVGLEGKSTTGAKKGWLW